MKKFKDWSTEQQLLNNINNIRNICGKYKEIISKVSLFGDITSEFDEESHINLFIYSDTCGMTTSKLLRNSLYKAFVLECFNVSNNKHINFMIACKDDRSYRQFMESKASRDIDETGVLIYDKESEEV